MSTLNLGECVSSLSDDVTTDACLSSYTKHVYDDDLSTPVPQDKKIYIDATYDSNRNLLVAFTDFVIAEGAVRILAFDSDLTLTQDTVSDVEEDSFAFFTVPYSSRVFIVSVGSRVVMDEFDVRTGRVTNVFINCADNQAVKYSSLTIDRQLGAQNYIKVIQDESILLTYEYHGIEGLRSKEPIIVGSLNIDHPINSCSSVSYSDGSTSHYLKVMVGGEYITVLKGVLDNPVAKLEFDCPVPELPSSLLN